MSDIRDMINKFQYEERAGGMKAVGPLLQARLLATIKPLLELSGQTVPYRIDDLDPTPSDVHFIFKAGMRNGFPDLDSVTLPNQVVDADDPVKATEQWLLGRHRARIDAELADARKLVDRLEIEQARAHAPLSTGAPDGDS